MRVAHAIKFMRKSLHKYFPEQKKDRTEIVLDALKRAHSENRLHHAYIFAGPVGVGKSETVRDFASYIFPSSLEKIIRVGHPDLLWIEPEDGAIKVDAIRGLIRALSFAPLESNKRIVVLNQAHTLNPMASNALLKILEEPPHHTMFFLLCPDKALLLQTISSRCQLIRFHVLGEGMLRARLEAEFSQCTGDEIQLALAWAEGSISRARDFLNNEGLRSLRTRAQDELLKMWENCPRIPSSILQFAGTLEDESIDIVLDSWLSLLRDMSVAVSVAGASRDGQEVSLSNKDTEKRIFELSKKVQTWAHGKASPDAISNEWHEKSAYINRFRVQLLAHVNAKLAIENLIANLQVFSIGKMRQEM